MGAAFNGSTDGLSAAATGSPLSSSAGPFTIALWFKPANLTQTNKYLWVEIKSSQAALLWEYASDSVEFYTNGYSGTDPRTDSGIVIPDTGWHHVAYRKAASGASAWDKFLDGSKTSINASITFTLAATDTTQYWARTAGGTACACSLAEFAIWGAALTDAAIAQLAVDAKPSEYPTPWQYVPLFNSSTAVNGNAVSEVGTPTFDAADHPVSYPVRFPWQNRRHRSIVGVR